MQYSPKLKIAIEEVKDILKKHDIGGIVILHDVVGTSHLEDGSTHTEGFAEYLFHISPSYSAATLEGDRLKVKGKMVHYSSRQERDRRVGGTINMLEHLCEVGSMLTLQAMKMKEYITKIADWDSGKGDHTSHSQQNN